MAYIKIEFDLMDEGDQALAFDFDAWFKCYRWMRDNLNEQLLDFALNKRLFTYRQQIELVDLSNYFGEYMNICRVTPIHISYSDFKPIDDGCNKPSKFYLWLKIDSCCIGCSDFQELKDRIGSRLEGIFKEIYGQLSDGWGESLYFKIDNEETNQTDTFWPEFKKETMELVESIGD